MHGDTRYRVTKRLDLTKHILIQWNRMEVGDIVRQIEGLEADNTDLQKEKRIWKGASRSIICMCFATSSLCIPSY